MCLKPDDMQDVSDCLNVGALRFAPITLSTSLQMTPSVAEWSCIELLWSRLVPDALFSAFKTQNWKNDFFYIWLCRDDSRSAGRTSSSSCEQMCCCSGSYSLTDQSHHHKLINQHEPFRAPGAPGPRGLGASGQVSGLLGCSGNVIVRSILSLQMYTGEEDQCAAASETFLWMFYHICDCAESSSGGAAEDPGWELLTSSWRSRLHLFQPAADSEHLIVLLVCLFTVLVMLSCSLSSNDLNFPGLYCRPAL